MLKLFAIILILMMIDLTVSMPSIGYSDQKINESTSSSLDKTEFNMNNSTIKKIYETAEQVTNVTNTDSVLIQLQRIKSFRTIENQSNNDNIMILVIKKSNITNSTADIMERFNAYYIRTAKADSSSDGILSTIWNMMLQSTRQLMWRSVKSMFQRIRFLRPSSSMEQTEASSSSASTGRTLAFPIVFHAFNETIKNNNINENEPRVVLLIPEPFYPPDIVVPRTNDNVTNNVEQQFDNKTINKSIDEIKPKIINDLKSTNDPVDVGISKYLVRPVGAFSGLSVKNMEKRSIADNNGGIISLNLIKSEEPKTEPTKTTTTSWRSYFRAFGHGYVFAKLIG